MLGGLVLAFQNSLRSTLSYLAIQNKPAGESGLSDEEKSLDALPRDDLVVLLWPWDDDDDDTHKAQAPQEQLVRRRLRPPEVITRYRTCSPGW
jgi:hypothetical protein